MKLLRDIILIILITTILFSLLELFSYYKLCELGYDPFSKDKRYQYGKEASCYAVSDNTKNYVFNAHDSLGNSSSLQIDEHGFILGQQPIARKKPQGVTRIFILGGSTAFGAGQNGGAVNNFTYPGTNFNYDASIAGQLHASLKNTFPNRSFEVINAAVFNHQFHQNFIRYFEKIHDFNPDIIINIDGRNDNTVFTEMDTSGGYIPGEIYSGAKGEFDDLIELYSISRKRQWPFSVNLINHYIDLRTKYQGNNDNSKFEIDSFNNNSPKFDDYLKVKPLCIVNSKKFLWVVNNYAKQLSEDKIHAVFVLQPLLSRRVNQKELSNLETQMRQHIDKTPVLKKEDLKTALDLQLKNYTDENKQFVRNLFKDEILNISLLRDAYFYNDYLSPKIDSIFTENNHTYIDFGKELKGMGSDKEFYTDYCHLTAYGNWFMAQVIAQKIEPVIIKMQPN
jgi:hypothetical protein